MTRVIIHDHSNIHQGGKLRHAYALEGGMSGASDGDGGSGVSLPIAAGDVTYDPTASGLSSTDVQDAIDELQTEIGGSLPWSYAKADGGLAGDGTTDDTAAFQAWIASVTSSGANSGWFFFEPGTYLIAGNITIPAGTSSQITLTFQGPAHPPFQPLGSLPNPNGYAILRGTATTGAATIYGGASATNATVVVRDLICIGNNNPTITFWDLYNTFPGALTGLQIDTVSYAGGATYPTHSGAYGLILPREGNSNAMPLQQVQVSGYYNCLKLGELTRASGLVLSNCVNGIVVEFANHASLIESLTIVGFNNGIVATGAHYLDILQYDAEHVSGGSFVTTYDVNDASNLLHGHIRWFTVLSGSGPQHVFTINGGSNILSEEIGQPPAGAGATFATPAIVLGTAAAAGAATTAIRSDSTIVAFDATAPTTSAIGDSAATGSSAHAARRDHVHGREALSTATPLVESAAGAVGTGVKSSREDHVHPASSGGELLISDTPSTPLIFADILQNDAQTDLMYAG